MGGLLAGSVCYYGQLAGHNWPRHLRKIVFLGTPHHGTAFRRGGNWVTVQLGVSRYTAFRAWARFAAPASPISATAAFWTRTGRIGTLRRTGPRHTAGVLPLPEGVQCYAIGAAIPTGESVPSAPLLGDGLVPLRSTLGQHADPARSLPFPESQQWIGYGMNHWDLLNRSDVCGQIQGGWEDHLDRCAVAPMAWSRGEAPRSFVPVGIFSGTGPPATRRRGASNEESRG